MRRKKAKRVIVRVSTEEHELLCAKARAAGITVSALVRDHIGQVKIFNHADKERWFRTISAMDNSIAALAKAAAALNPLHAVGTLAYLAAIHRHLDRISQENIDHACEVFPPRNGRE